jgi:hypothetical protein
MVFSALRLFKLSFKDSRALSCKVKRILCMFSIYEPVFRIRDILVRIRIQRIHLFFDLPDPDPQVRGIDPDPALDPDPSIIMQK